MNEQPTFADLDYQHKRRRTRREEFLERMDSLIPWQRLEDRIGPHYFRSERGRRPYPLAVMLRVHIVQLCYNLSDPAMEDLLYEAESVRRFAGLRLSEPIPDESTILHFRHLLERHELGQGLFEAHRLLHGEEQKVWGDAGYIGVQKREENLGLAVDWQVAMKPGQRRQLEPESDAALGEKVKASIRAKVEHPFLDVKRLFGYAKVRYQGLAKNTNRLALLLGLSDLKRAQALLAD